MLNRLPKFAHQTLEGAPELGADITLPPREDEITLAKIALENIAFMREVMGPSLMSEKLLPTKGIASSDRLTLRRTDDYYAVSMYEQRRKLGSGQADECRWDYLYYANLDLAHLAQVDITMPNPFSGKGRLLKRLGTVSMQRFMTVRDHQYVRELLHKM